MNRDQNLFKYLWVEHMILWNLGHFVCCLNYIIQLNWEIGLKILFEQTTSKVIFMSINDPQLFVEAIFKLKAEISMLMNENPTLTKKIKEFMLIGPYFMTLFFLELAQNNPN